MGFLSELGKKTSQTTEKITKETKLKIKINDTKRKISDLYEEIGKKVYEAHIREGKACINSDIEACCARVDELSKEIEDARLEILKLNKKRLCVKCSAEIEENALFCPKCGEKQVAEATTVKEEALETLENTEVEPEKQEEAESVKEDLKEETNNQ